MHLLEEQVEAFCVGVVAWASENLRDFPWRAAGSSVYLVLAAELLLKRTTASAAARVYPLFVRRFPSVAALAEASQGELAQVLAPIGLNTQRAQAIAQLARYLIEQEDGTIPPTLSRLLAVPALGPYSARAVLSLGFGIPAAIVDSNVERVLGRVFARTLPRRPTKHTVQRIADAVMPLDSHRKFNLALLDLGATVCRYRDPRHESCPVRNVCDFYLQSQRTTAERRTTVHPLRAARLARHLSLPVLAQRAQVAKITIVNIEAGRQRPRPQTLQKLARALEIDPRELVGSHY